MLRVTQPQLTLWDAVLPPELLQLNEELSKVDKLLDDADVMAPFLEHFSCRIGRPTVPIDTFLRLMYLKFRYQLGFETLVEEVRDSLMWRRFCRIPLDGEVPDSTTLIKLRKKYGADTVDRVNEILIERARDRKIIRGRKLRVDTTVVPSDIHYPTDASLLADGIRTITRTVTKLKDMGVAASTAFRDRTRSTRKRMLSINKVVKRRTGQVWDEVRAITGEVLEIAQKVSEDAHRILANARQTLRRSPERVAPRAKALLQKLNHYVTVTERIMVQTDQVQRGERVISDRVVSLFDTGARPIRKGKVKAPTEFGYKVLIQETEDRIITGYQVHKGNPADRDLLPSAVDRHEHIFGDPPEEAATDRGFYSARGEKDLYERGVRHVSMPKPGKLSRSRREHQRTPQFRRLQRFRAGGEATISLYKRKYGGDRSRFRDESGTEAWVGWGIMSLNLRRMTQKI